MPSCSQTVVTPPFLSVIKCIEPRQWWYPATWHKHERAYFLTLSALLSTGLVLTYAYKSFGYGLNDYTYYPKKSSNTSSSAPLQQNFTIYQSTKHLEHDNIGFVVQKKVLSSSMSSKSKQNEDIPEAWDEFCAFVEYNGLIKQPQMDNLKNNDVVKQNVLNTAHVCASNNQDDAIPFATSSFFNKPCTWVQDIYPNLAAKGTSKIVLHFRDSVDCAIVSDNSQFYLIPLRKRRE